MVNQLQPDIEQVLHTADAAVASPAIALDPQRIGQLARRRVYKRRAAMGAVGTCCLLVATYFAATRFDREQDSIASRPESSAAQLLAQLDRLHGEFDNAMLEAQETLDNQTASSDPSFIERWQQAARLAELQQEVARLEAQQQPPGGWQLAWLRAGARRLALANFDAATNPDMAERSYRTLAANYAGSPISDAALRALEDLPQ